MLCVHESVMLKQTRTQNFELFSMWLVFWKAFRCRSGKTENAVIKCFPYSRSLGHLIAVKYSILATVAMCDYLFRLLVPF